MSVDDHPAGSGVADHNGVLEPGETAVAAPAWKNTGASASAADRNGVGVHRAVGSDLHDPRRLRRLRNDRGRRHDGLLRAPAATAISCSSPRPRSGPIQHWDASFQETLSAAGIAKTWTLHVGDSFTDVPRSQLFYKKIETLFHSGITSGCGGTLYCPVRRGRRARRWRSSSRKGIAGSGSQHPGRRHARRPALLLRRGRRVALHRRRADGRLLQARALHRARRTSRRAARPRSTARRAA